MEKQKREKNKDIAIRHAEAQDVRAIYAMIQQPLCYRNTCQPPCRDIRFYQQRFESLDENMINLVAECQGIVVGNAGLKLMNSSPRQKHIGQLFMLVHSEYHGKGVGSALMAELISLADNWHNLRRLELTVYTDNAPAIGLYQKFGFEIEGTLRDFGFTEGQFLDAYMMSRIKRNTAC